MTRNRWLMLLLAFVIAVWCITAFALLEDKDLILIPFFIVTMALTVWVFWRMAVIEPRDRLREIHALAGEIEKRVEDNLDQLAESDFPGEIVPIIRSINHFMRYQRDRYQQERDFTAHASHELRTPLSGIRLQTEVALRTDDPALKEKSMRSVLGSIDRATRLVEQLLILSRLTADRLELEMEKTELSKLCAQAIADIGEIARNAEISLSLEKKSGDVFASVNAESMMILLSNLIRNSLAFTPRGGWIAVATELDGGDAVLSVTDSGPGIPPEKREVVLKPFQKGDKQSKTGTGLGLSIVSRIVDLHGGRFVLKDAPGGHGLRAEVRLRREDA